ncbi:MAG: methyl-accepting chemotaxis protein, partial [Magnetococcales bacterium]|nr:methyl-accepting chemotaxis protein [Magnetococcales bacterium]
MKDMKLALKLGMGFGIVLILTVVVGLAGWNGISGVTDRTLKVEGVSALGDDLSDARIAVRNFMLDNKKADEATKATTKLDEMKKEATELRDKFTDPANKAQMEAIAKASAAYRDEFQIYADFAHKRAATMEKIREAANVALKETQAIADDQEAQLKETVEKGKKDDDIAANRGEVFARVLDKYGKIDKANEVISEFLTARKNEKELIINNDEKFAHAVVESAAGIKKKIEEMIASYKLEKNREQGKKALAAMGVYEGLFKEYRDLMQKQAEVFKTMGTAANEAVKFADEAIKDQKGKMQSQIGSANTLIISGSLLAIILGLIVAFVIT